MQRHLRKLAGLLVGIPIITFAADLTLQVNLPLESNLHNKTVYVAVFDESGYLRQPLQGHRLTAEGSVRQLVLHDLPAAGIALTAYVDVNDNGMLDKNLMGRPSEPFGFSNQASSAFGPPKWSAVAVIPAGQLMEISLQP